ncbi:putative RNA methyltransferase [Euzebya tangerina]|uniref:putative RNA methyltransferase n=1 Tax=Euzebya tangerina TaxID=591198 RepID=UPI000E3157A2|nr:methyltransferase domain-containing protein [Euzebya tangerina]
MTIDVVIDLLRCPVCHGRLRAEPTVVVCHDGHRFDRARQGFVTLSRTGIRHPGDTAAMVMARERVQRAGLLDTVRDAIRCAMPTAARTLVDLGAGTGFYAAAVVGDGSDRVGVALDSSKPALRRAARAHDRIGAVGADLTAALPLHDASIDACLVAFSPRNLAEIRRVVAPGGVIVVVTPTSDHLAELVGPLAMLTVPAGKRDQIIARFGDAEVVTSQQVRTTVEVTPAQAADLAAMGPTGFHHDTETLAARAATHLAGQHPVTVSVDVTTLRLPSAAQPLDRPPSIDGPPEA